MSKKRKTKADLETELSAEKAKLSASEAENKRRKSAIDAVTKEYVCPITLELPVDPVIAEDGRAYNRADIQKHIDAAKKKKEDEDDDEEDDDDGNNDDGDVYKYLRSPLTNEPMGPKLVPAVQVRNSIRALVESGAVDADLAKRWKEVDDMRKKAEAGDAEAMHALSDWYYFGNEGMIQDYEMSYYWVKKAADLNHVGAMADQGLVLYNGQGVDRNLSEGSLLLGTAAALGSSNAAFYIGRCYYKEEDSAEGAFPKVLAKTKYWIKKALDENDISCDKLTEDSLKQAKELLKKVEEEIE